MPTQAPSPDTIGPYKIDVLLGTGGMGEVYKAFDPRLDRWVAVKHIKAEYSRKDGYRQRLEREAKTIASLDHPSIVQVFDVLEDDDGSQWIVMELVDGPTVYDMLEDGPLELATVLTIALDVIHGLARAHSQGVLHRDLKSENVMVSRTGVAKILDFGLSKRLQNVEEASLSVEGRVIGTCRVMAPEQADGQELDGRADLFAFGILLYEMVTARSPFRASTPVASMLKAFGEPHAPVHHFNPDVPEALSDLIDWLLKKNRDHRPENARVVAARLAEIATAVSDDPAELAARLRMASRSWHGSDGLPAPHARARAVDETQLEDPLDDTVPGGPSDPADRSRAASSHAGRRTEAVLSREAMSQTVEQALSRPGRSAEPGLARGFSAGHSSFSSMVSTALGLNLSPQRRFLAWTAWVLAALTLWWAVASITRPGVVQEPEEARLVVLPFENHGPDSMAHFAAGLTDELIRELTARRDLAVVSYRTSTQYGSGDKSLRQIGEELDIGYVIEGGVASGLDPGTDPRLRISLRLVRVADGEVLLSQSLDRTASDTLRVQSEIADAVSAELGAQILVDSRRDLSADPLALDAYFRGLTLHHDSGFSLDVAQRAERFFSVAVEEDSEFTRAWVELSRVHSFLYFNWDRSRDRRLEAERALSRARDLAPESTEVHLASGYFEYYVREQLEQALWDFQQAEADAPHDPEVQQAIGLILRRQGKLNEAIEALQRAFDLDRANSSLAGILGETERARRAYGRAERWFEIALQRGSDLAYVVGARAENILALRGCGDLGEPPACPTSEALEVFRDSEIGESPSLWFYRLRVGLFQAASRGDLEQYLDIFESVDVQNQDQGERLLVYWRKALVLRELGRSAEAEEVVQRSRRELEVIAEGSELDHHHALLALAYSLDGQRDEAEAAMRHALDLAQADSFSGPRIKKWAAAMVLWHGDEERALALLTELGRTDYQWSLASYEVQADPLWQPLREKNLLDDLWRQLRNQERRSEHR